MTRDDLVVLSVDDDAINLMLLKSLLVRSGMVKEVVEAKNGQEAIDILKSRDDIDIVLLDIIMPVMGGMEMLKNVRADTALYQPPIIILTTDETRKVEALELGANEFVTKPVRSDELMEKMKSVVV